MMGSVGSLAVGGVGGGQWGLGGGCPGAGSGPAWFWSSRCRGDVQNYGRTSEPKLKPIDLSPSFFAPGAYFLFFFFDPPLLLTRSYTNIYTPAPNQGGSDPRERGPAIRRAPSCSSPFIVPRLIFVSICFCRLG